MKIAAFRRAVRLGGPRRVSVKASDQVNMVNFWIFSYFTLIMSDWGKLSKKDISPNDRRIKCAFNPTYPRGRRAWILWRLSITPGDWASWRCRFSPGFLYETHFSFADKLRHSSKHDPFFSHSAQQRLLPAVEGKAAVEGFWPHCLSKKNPSRCVLPWKALAFHQAARPVIWGVRCSPMPVFFPNGKNTGYTLLFIA